MSKSLASTSSKFRLVFCLAAAAVIGCGGEVDSDPNPSGKPAPGSDMTNGGSGDGTANPDGLLADCRPGFPPSQATADRPCQFFVGTSCYVTQEEACGCVCPRDVGPVLCVADGNAYLPGTPAYGVWCWPKRD